MNTISVLIATAGLLGILCTASAAPPPKDAAWVKQRVKEWQPTASEKRWESIGWATGLKAALSLAKQHQRPVFLFTLDGKMNVGRC